MLNENCTSDPRHESPRNTPWSSHFHIYLSRFSSRNSLPLVPTKNSTFFIIVMSLRNKHRIIFMLKHGANSSGTENSIPTIQIPFLRFFFLLQTGARQHRRRLKGKRSLCFPTMLNSTHLNAFFYTNTLTPLSALKCVRTRAESCRTKETQNKHGDYSLYPNW